VSGPPSNIDPGDLFLQITQMPRPSRLVPFPRKGPDGEPVCQVAFWVMTQAEKMGAIAATEAWVRKQLKDALASATEARRGYEDLYANRASLEILFRAARHPQDLTKPFFRTQKDIADHLTQDEVAVLFNAYLRLEHELGPIVSELSDTEMEAWLLTLATGGATVPLDSLSWGARTQLMSFLARRALISSMGTSSPTTPPDDDSVS
jgi:hypothetical protein